MGDTRNNICGATSGADVEGPVKSRLRDFMAHRTELPAIHRAVNAPLCRPGEWYSQKTVLEVAGGLCQISKEETLKLRF
jgi:hypothetical protein